MYFASTGSFIFLLADYSLKNAREYRPTSSYCVCQKWLSHFALPRILGGGISKKNFVTCFHAQHLIINDGYGLRSDKEEPSVFSSMVCRPPSPMQEFRETFVFRREKEPPNRFVIVSLCLIRKFYDSKSTR